MLSPFLDKARNHPDMMEKSLQDEVSQNKEQPEAVALITVSEIYPWKIFTRKKNSLVDCSGRSNRGPRLDRQTGSVCQECNVTPP